MHNSQIQQAILIEQQEIAQSRCSLSMIVRFILVSLITLWGCTMTDRETDMSAVPVHTPPLSIPSSSPEAIQTAINHPSAEFSLAAAWNPITGTYSLGQGELATPTVEFLS